MKARRYKEILLSVLDDHMAVDLPMRNDIIAVFSHRVNLEKKKQQKAKEPTVAYFFTDDVIEQIKEKVAEETKEKVGDYLKGLHYR